MRFELDLSEEEIARLRRAQRRDDETLDQTLLRLSGLRAEAPSPGRPPGDAILRIKRIREESLCGLKEAKDALEACGYDADAAVRLLRAVGVDHVGRRGRDWTADDVSAATYHDVNNSP